jgi:anti-sigma regulatory factor (Ser/Thr protein kinase)
MRDGGGELIQYRLVMEPRAARRARQVVGAVLDGWPLGGLADDVVSCVSELVANVYEHAAKSATAELLVSWIPGHSLTVEVRDQDSRMPRRRRTAELGVLPFALIDTDADDWQIMQLAEAGRGLALVDALCDRLTWQPNSGGGKVVRCHWRLKAVKDTARNCSRPPAGPRASIPIHPPER